MSGIEIGNFVRKRSVPTIHLFILWCVMQRLSCVQSVNVVLQSGSLSSRSREDIQRVCASRDQRILVTGAAGFIGFHASLALRRQGYAVVGIDNFNPYYPVSLKLNREALLLDQYIPVVRADITDLKVIQGIFTACAFSHVLHLAAQPGVRYAMRHPFTYINSNIIGSTVMLEVLKSMDVKPMFVYASSSSVYGLSKRLPFSEGDRADTPASLYAATKRSQELLTHAYCNCFGISATGLRFFTVYGPWGRPDMAVMSFARNILIGRDIRVFLGPNNTTLSRDFTYIDDIVNGILRSIATAPSSQSGSVSHRIFNLGNSVVVNVLDMVKILENYLGRRARISFISRINGGEVLVTNANITLAASSLGYTPNTNISAGLQQFVKWFLKYTRSAEHDDMLRYIPD
ncbi:NAD-dependent epimerase/dehydratase [Dunaliella salina]|uniref:NAD-dependent epimerase/dehydratase n=1 Tax=Dunaliella salina TaxID=3046 RepID=A0ABQ7FTV1_DUNSA|nr:NAD-dependent epimerase/dehydratase [Dunaliella salina]|eukprot:KAF5825623.1 NAD-dependent epimerase/dehydratase [Dunaliella salina]